MSKQKLKARARSAPTVVARPPLAEGEGRVLGFLKRWSVLLAVLAVGTAAARIVSTYDELSITTDEPGHFAGGLQYLSQHVYTYETQHPPLSRAMVALLPYLNGMRILDDDTYQNREGYKILDHSGNPDRVVRLMRVGVLPFFLLACLVVYGWARHYFGAAAACLSVAFFTLTPQVLADGGLATTDMALAACLGAAFYVLLLWVESPTWMHSVLLGTTCALAALSKFTALGFLPAAAVLAFAGYIIVRRPGLRGLLLSARARILAAVLAIAVGCLLVWAAYFFSFGEVKGWDGALPAPEFFDGIRAAMAHNAEGHLSYLMGRFSTSGWWWYFPAALTFKTPIPLLLFAAAGMGLALARREALAYLPAAFFLGVLLPSMTGHVNIGVRHILPAYLAMAILGAIALVHLLRWRGIPAAVRVAVAVMPFASMAVSATQVHPDYLAYFNALAGSKPENVLLDSNFDWGENWKLLARRLRERGVPRVHGYGLEAQGLYPTFRRWWGLPEFFPLDPQRFGEADPGWTVVRIAAQKQIPEKMYMPSAQRDPWYYRVAPTERFAGFLFYRVPASSAPGR